MAWIFQIVVILVALFAISRALLRLREHKLSGVSFALWTAVWFAVIVFAFWPSTSELLSAFAGIERGVDLIVYISIVILFYLVFRLTVRTETIDQNLSKLVRRYAIDKKRERR